MEGRFRTLSLLCPNTDSRATWIASWFAGADFYGVYAAHPPA